MVNNGMQGNNQLLRSNSTRETQSSRTLIGGTRGDERSLLAQQQETVSDTRRLGHDIEEGTHFSDNVDALRGAPGRVSKRNRPDNDLASDQIGLDALRPCQRVKVEHVEASEDDFFRFSDLDNLYDDEMEPPRPSCRYASVSGYHKLEQGSSSGSSGVQSATTTATEETDSEDEEGSTSAGTKRSATFSCSRVTKRQRGSEVAIKIEEVEEEEQQEQQSEAISTDASLDMLIATSTSPLVSDMTFLSAPGMSLTSSTLNEEQEQNESTESVVGTEVLAVTPTEAVATEETTEEPELEVINTLFGLDNIAAPEVQEETQMNVAEQLTGLATEEPLYAYMMLSYQLLVEIAQTFMGMVQFVTDIGNQDLLLFEGQEQPTEAETIIFTRETMDEQIPMVHYTPADEREDCPICTDAFEEQDELRVLKCNHNFHDECIMHWFTSGRNTCPLCRRNIVQRADVSSSNL